MTTPPSKTCEHYLNRWTGIATVISNRQAAQETGRIRLRCPELAQRVRPGQFLMLRLCDKTDPLLGRAFAVYDADPDSGEIEVLYLVVGKMTQLLMKVQPGGQIAVTGPLGNGWDAIEDEDYSRFGKSQYETNDPPLHVVMVAGGIGQTPFHLVAREHRALNRRAKLTLIMGARTRERLCCVDEFQALGVDVRIATEDGSEGTKGFVTSVLDDVLASSAIRPSQMRIMACGPTPMLKAVWHVAEKKNLRCWVSLESAMSCGLGICYGCAIEYLVSDKTWDYRRVCVDGPVFDAWRLKWD